MDNNELINFFYSENSEYKNKIIEIKKKIIDDNLKTCFLKKKTNFKLSN